MTNLFINRIFRAIKIDIDLYEEVEKDKSATIQAGIVVVLSSLAAGVGALQMGASNFLLAPVFSSTRASVSMKSKLISLDNFLPIEVFPEPIGPIRIILFFSLGKIIFIFNSII